MKRKLMFLIGLSSLCLTSCINALPSVSTPAESTPQETVNPGETSTSDVISDSTSSEISASDVVTESPLEVYVLEMCGIYGDSLYLQQGNFDILIDAGWDTDGAYVRDFVDSHLEDGVLDLLVVTHAHGDHVGGMTTALTNVETITNIIDYGTFATAPSGSENGLAGYEALKKTYINAGTTYTSAYAAVNEPGKKVLQFSEDFSVEVLNTNCYHENGIATSKSANESSVSLLFKYKDFTFLSQGDGTTGTEEQLMAHETLSEVTMYKSSHHGSNGSNSRKFLDTINPKQVVFSASRALSYSDRTNKEVNKTGTSGHPSADAVQRIYATGNIAENRNVYWNMYAGTMKFTTYGADEAVPLEGFGPERLGYYELVNGEYVKVTGEENAKFHETKVFKARGYEPYLNQTPSNPGEDNPGEDNPGEDNPTNDYADMAYTSYTDFIDAADGTMLKVKGVVSGANSNTGFIHDGENGYYIYDKTVVPTLEIGKTYTLVGSKKNYNGIQELTSVVYSAVEETNCEITTKNISSLNFATPADMKYYHTSVGLLENATVKSIPDLSNYTKTSYSLTTTLDGKDIKVSVDKNYIGEEAYNASLEALAGVIVGQTISFEAVVIVKSSSVELMIVDPSKISASAVSNETLLANSISKVSVSATIPNDVTSIVLPTQSDDGKVSFTWASSNPAVISTSGVVTAADSDQTVTLTLTATLGTDTLTKEFTSCVLGGGSSATLAYTETFTHANSTASGSYGGSGIKGGYAKADATFTAGYSWTLDNALHGSLANDKPYTGSDESWCIRMKPVAEVITNFTFTNLSYVDFYYAGYGSSTGSTIKVYYSIDGGNTWVDTNSSFETTSEPTLGRVYINQTEACMIKFVMTDDDTGAKANIDHVSFYTAE